MKQIEESEVLIFCHTNMNTFHLFLAVVSNITCLHVYVLLMYYLIYLSGHQPEW